MGFAHDDAQGTAREWVKSGQAHTCFLYVEALSK